MRFRDGRVPEGSSTRKPPSLLPDVVGHRQSPRLFAGFHQIAPKINRFFVSESIIFAFCSLTRLVISLARHGTRWSPVRRNSAGHAIYGTSRLGGLGSWREENLHRLKPVVLFDRKTRVESLLADPVSCSRALSRSFEGLIFSEVDNGQSQRINGNQCVGYALFDHENEVPDVTLAFGLGVIWGGVEHFFKLDGCLVG